MENATQALLIAAGVLMGVMILSLGAALYSELDLYVQTSHRTIDFNELNKFNTQFTKYINYVSGEKQFDLTIQDVVTAANCAYQNNIDNEATEDERNDENSLYVAIYLNGDPIEHIIHKNTDSSDLTEAEKKLTATALLNAELSKDSEKKYICKDSDVKFSSATSRVYQVYFWDE